jgi:arginine decarboxylase
MGQRETPYFAALLDYSRRNRVPLDVPGHKMGLIGDDLVRAVGRKTFSMDVNTPDGLDNLNSPHGVIREAQALFAEAFKADRAFFLTGGTTIGILSIIMATVRDDEKIIVPRNVHKSVISALVISGAIPVFVEPMVDAASGIANHMPLEAFKRAVDDNPDARAVLVINPTYFGVASDIRSMVEYAHSRGMIVLADEAHGSHMVFHDSLPLTAMQAGADLSATSIHKTSGSLTQSSAILAKGDRVDYPRLVAAIHMVQSTSPSSLMLASLDVARKHMYHHANGALTKLFPVIDGAIGELNAIDGIRVLAEPYFRGLGSHAYDRTKIIVDVSGLGMTGFEVYKVMSADFNIQLELAEANVVLCVLSIATTRKHLRALVSAFRQLSRSHKRDKPAIKTYKSNGHPVLHTKPRTAYNAPSRVVTYKDSIGRVSAGSVMIYPPGIPILIPGEVVSAQIVEDLAYYVAQGSTVLSEAPKGFIKVVDSSAPAESQDPNK